MKGIVEKILEGKVAGTRLFIVEVLLVKNKLEIFLDSDGGVSIDECAALNVYLHRRLEELNTDIDNYIVEISSPGLDRDLKEIRSFKKNVGRSLRVRNSQNRYISGKLAMVDQDGIMLVTGNQNKNKELIRYTDIKEAKAAI
jgi:ribosome maturation factor RimP